MEPAGPHSPHLEVQIDLCGARRETFASMTGTGSQTSSLAVKCEGRAHRAFDSRGWRSYTRDVQQEILEVFVEAVRQVFRETDIEIESVDAGDEKGTEDSVITSVGLTGDLKGIFMIRTDTASTAAILRAMTGGVRITLERDRLSEMQMAALGELTNQISGRAITLLFNHRLRCDITPPAVIAARQLQSLVPSLAASFNRTIRGPFGRLTVFLGLQESSVPDL